MDKSIVSGTVTFDGAPIANGEIRFYPKEGTTGPVSGAPIVNGHYEAKAKGGVPAGSHQVQIRGFRPQGAAAAGGESGPVVGDGGGHPEQYLPPQFNDSSTLELIVEPGAGTMEKNFELAP